MITPTTPLEHILQLHVSTLRPVLGNIERKHIHDLNTCPPVRLSRYSTEDVVMVTVLFREMHS
jgi:hypothetical protein